MRVGKKVTTGEAEAGLPKLFTCTEDSCCFSWSLTAMMLAILASF